MTTNEEAQLRAELAAELGFYPASVDLESIAKHRRLSAEADANHQAYKREYGPSRSIRDRTRHRLPLPGFGARHGPIGSRWGGARRRAVQSANELLQLIWSSRARNRGSSSPPR
jgi:hypothetical protein